MGSPAGNAGRIAVDAMGGDLGPSEVVEAVRLALSEFPSLFPVTLVGDEAKLTPLLKRAHLLSHPKVSVVHASEVIAMDDEVMQTLKRKRDASMFRAIELVKAGEAGAVVSTGNTKILVAAGTLKLRTLDGIERPALAPVIPRDKGYFILIDAGANPEARVEHLVHNALLGTHYCRVVLGVERPRVGLLTIGTEEGKGNALIAETNDALKRLGTLIDYKGPVEGFQVFFDNVDVVVCDGFVGNICLKSWESLVKFFQTMLKDELKANPLRMAGALIAQGAFGAVKRRIQPERYGGAPLLGLRGNVLKAHGSANRHAIKSAIRDASEFIRIDLNRRIEADVSKANEILHPTVTA
ncbi:phosphate acyltransferase [mine drainage metagenome]|uniref:phosphate acyltransferase n=1 Tax=mine drainage metagenome TaxID=410659 RepID=A0A1J5R880_9ZZZZ